MTTSSLPKTVKSCAQSLLGVAALSAIAFVGVPQSAKAANILLGSDYLNTPAGSSFFNFPGLLSPVQFQGRPIELPIGPGNTDTIIQRKQDCIFGVNNSCQIDIEMVDLSLESSAPVNIGGSLFNVFVSLTPGKNSTGTMTINHESTDNNNPAPEGTFTSVLDVFFDAKFTPVGGGASCTLFAGPNCTLSLFSQLEGNGLWGHEPPPGAVIVNGLPGDQVANLHRPLVPGFNDFFIFGIGNHDHKNFAGQHNVVTTTCPIGLPGCPRGEFVNMPMPGQQRNIKPVPEPSTVLASILLGLTAMFGLKKKQQSQKA